MSCPTPCVGPEGTGIVCCFFAKEHWALTSVMMQAVWCDVEMLWLTNTYTVPWDHLLYVPHWSGCCECILTSARSVDLLSFVPSVSRMYRVSVTSHLYVHLCVWELATLMLFVMHCRRLCFMLYYTDSKTQCHCLGWSWHCVVITMQQPLKPTKFVCVMNIHQEYTLLHNL